MHLGQAMPMVGAGQREESFKLFSRHIDREWIARALQATGSATVRRRKLPAEYVVWIVVGTGLLRAVSRPDGSLIMRSRPRGDRISPPRGAGRP